MNNKEEANSVFEQPWWLNIVANEKWHELIIRNKNNECISRLPYVDLSLYGIKYIGTPLFTQQMGPWFKDSEGIKTVNKIKNIKQATEQFINLLNNTKNVDLYFHNSFYYVLPFIWHGYKVTPYFSYIIDNLEDLNKVFNNMDSKVRNSIRSAEKNLDITFSVRVEDLIMLLEETFNRQKRKLPFDKNMIINIYNESISRGAGKIIGAIDKSTGKIASVVFLLYDKNTCYYLFGGKNYNMKNCGAQELILWEGIKFASKVSKKFDFEGSMIPNIESFFRGFGGKPVVYYRVFKGSILFKLLHFTKPFIKKILKYK